MIPRLTGLTLIAAMTLLASSPIRAADTKSVTTPERQKLLDAFPRTGLNTTPGDAMMLRILIEARGAKRGVEVGAASGYGAVNMGIGFERTGGQLISVDIDPDMVRQTKENVKAFGLEQTVTVVQGDALVELPKITGEIDFVFIDALKRDYLKYFKALEPKLAHHAVVVADNVIKSAGEMGDFLKFMEQSPDWQMVIIRASEEKGDGMAICYKVR